MPVQTFLQPVIALILWTFVVWIWMYATRIPAMHKAHVHPQSAQSPRGEWRFKLPDRVNWVADNYNHLHEQPIVFYVLMLSLAVMGAQSTSALVLAWIYVGLRILHSLVQIVGNWVVLRFACFVLASITLMALSISAAVIVFTA